jgi:hypothetical protein
MKAHTDKLTAADFHRAAPGDVYVSITEHGSRSRARRFDFRLEALRPTGRFRNSGTYGAEPVRAATWDEHGEMFAPLFDLDPAAIIGPYDGREAFHEATGGKYRTDAAILAAYDLAVSILYGRHATGGESADDLDGQAEAAEKYAKAARAYADLMRRTEPREECGCCGAYHEAGFAGDCREDEARFAHA